MTSERPPVAVFAAALLLFAIGVAPAWPVQIDDTFITLAYVHELLEHGALQWSSGERVEGFSNLMYLLMLTPWVALGFDGGVVSQWIALLAGLSTVGLLWLLLRDSSADRMWLLIVAGCPALGFWSGMGMETTLHSLILMVLWGAAAPNSPFAERRRGPLLFAALCLAALSRHDGSAHVVVAGLVASLWTPGLRRWVMAAALATVGYHLARWGYFGSLVPTPAMVKVGAGNTALNGVTACALASLAAAPVVLPGLFTRRVDGSMVVALLPLGIQEALLASIGSDWMGHGRLLLPGALACAAVLASSPAEERRPVWPVALCFVGLFIGSIRDDLPELRIPSPMAVFDLTREFGTPLQEDIGWLIENVPNGGQAMMSDVGMPGNIEGIVIQDSFGLTDYDVAAYRAGTDSNALDRLLARYEGGPKKIDAIRTVSEEAGPSRPLPAEFAKYFGPPDLVLNAGGTRRALWYRRPAPAPTDAQVLARWDALIGRYPSQSWLGHARKQSVAGQLARGHGGWVVRPDLGDRGLHWARLNSNGVWEASVPPGAPVAVVMSAELLDGVGAEGVVRCGGVDTRFAVGAEPEVVAGCVTGPDGAVQVTFENDEHTIWGDRNLVIWGVVASP